MDFTVAVVICMPLSELDTHRSLTAQKYINEIIGTHVELFAHIDTLALADMQGGANNSDSKDKSGRFHQCGH